MRLSHKRKVAKKQNKWRPRKRIMIIDEAHMFFAKSGKPFHIEPLTTERHSATQSLSELSKLNLGGNKSDYRLNPAITAIIEKRA